MRYPYQNSFVANDYYLLVSHTPASYPYVTPNRRIRSSTSKYSLLYLPANENKKNMQIQKYNIVSHKESFYMSSKTSLFQIILRKVIPKNDDLFNVVSK